MHFAVNFLKVTVPDDIIASEFTTSQITNDESIDKGIRRKLINICKILSDQCNNVVEGIELECNSDNNVHIRSYTANGIYEDDYKKSPQIKKIVKELMQLIKKNKIHYSGDNSIPVYPLIISCNISNNLKSNVTVRNKIKKLFQKFFVLKFLIIPSCEKAITRIIKSTNSNDLRNIYINQKSIFANFKVHLATKNPIIIDLFKDTEIDVILERLLSKLVNQQNKNKPTFHIWKGKTLNQLNILKLLNDLKFNNSTNLINNLSKIDFLDIPLEQLSELIITNENKNILINLWKNITLTLYKKGNIDNLVMNQEMGSIIQCNYITKYIATIEHMPQEIRQELELILSALEIKSPLGVIKDILLQSNITSNSLSIENIHQQSEQKIYKEKIIGLIGNFYNSKAKDSDIMPLINVLGVSKRSDFKEIANLIGLIHASLTEEERKIFPQERLVNLFWNQGENLAINKYNLTASQIKNLKKFRELSSLDFTQLINLEIGLKKYYSLMKTGTIQNIEIATKMKLQIFGQFLSIFDQNSENISFEKINKFKGLFSLTSENNLLIAENILSKLVGGYHLKGFNTSLTINKEILGKLNTYKMLKTLFSNMLWQREKAQFSIFLKNIEEFIPSEARAYLLLPTPKSDSINIYDIFITEELSSTQKKNNNIFSVTDQNSILQFCKLREKSKYTKLTLEESFEISNLINTLKSNNHLLKILRNAAKKKTTILDYFDSIFLKHIYNKFGNFENIDLPAGISLDNVSELLKIIVEVKYAKTLSKKIGKINVKAHRLFKIYQNNLPVRPRDKLTLRELGIISHSARLNFNANSNFIELVNRLRLNEVNSEIDLIIQDAQSSQKVFDLLNSIYKPLVDSHFSSGNLLAYVGNKKSAWTGKHLTIDEKFASFASSGLTHAGKLFKKEGRFLVSHITGEHTQDDFDLYQICVSNIWEIDLIPLIPSSMHEILKLTYGDQWQQVVKKIYQEIENVLHTKALEQFAKVQNPWERRRNAGLADYHVLFQLIGKKVLSHSKSHDANFDKIYQKFFNDEECEVEEQICSEWASEATLAAMMETNKRIAQDIALKYENRFDGTQILSDLEQQRLVVPTHVSEYLKGVRHWKSARQQTQRAEKNLIKVLGNQNYSKDEIELIIRLGNKEIFDLPYSRRERFKTIHPGRMVKLLVKKQCAHIKEPPPELKRLIAF